MEKKSILPVFFFLCFITFALSQDEAHTPTSIGLHAYQSFDNRFMEKLIAENPSLSKRWNFEPRLNWSDDLMDLEKPPIVFPSNRVENVDSYALFIKERERNLQMKIDPRNLNDIESRPFNSTLFLPLKNIADNLNGY